MHFCAFMKFPEFDFEFGLAHFTARPFKCSLKSSRKYFDLKINIWSCCHTLSCIISTLGLLHICMSWSYGNTSFNLKESKECEQFFRSLSFLLLLC